MIGIIDLSYAIAVLVLVVLGLAIVFGMLGCINMAHGEKVMLGSYAVFVTQDLPFSLLTNFMIGMLFAVAVSAITGGIMYWLVIQRIQARLLDSILATWGVSLVLKQVVALMFGAQGQNVTVPFSHTLTIFGSQYPLYRVFVIGASISVLCLLYVVFFKSHFGVQARAVMSNPSVAQSIGINSKKIHFASFMIGSGVAGFAGAILAPLMSISPFVGETYLVPAFLSILVGGLGSIISSLLGTGVIGGIQAFTAIMFDSVIAQIVMLVSAIALLKRFPDGMFTKKK